MKKILLLICLYITHIQAQEHAWVYFKDKPNAQSYLDNPLTMLTQRALDRRANQDILISIQDAPIEDTYIYSVQKNEGITIKAKSKWLNALHVYGTQEAITQLRNISIIDSIQFANKYVETISSDEIFSSKISKIDKFNDIDNNIYDYGIANRQVSMVGIDEFHNAGFQGQGMQIAVIDSGFYGVNTAGAFSHLVDNDETNGEILGGFDFVNNNADYYLNTGSTHGTNVLSTMGAIKENEYVGTAPKASFYLFVTEDSNSETPLEESLWVQAAERADSLGVDIINTSLGYSLFDESIYNYSYEDMDGETTFITRGANIAAEKGMVIVNSAGNSGNDSWKYITAPADAKNIVAVGAVDGNKDIVSFSSYGPTSDNRIKPETLAQGGGVYVITSNNNVAGSNGTSFSGPIIAGTIACLWQAYSEKTSLEIREMVIENSELYPNPTDQEGYGVFNANLLGDNLSLSSILPFNYKTVSDNLILELNQGFNEVFIEVFSVVGQTMFSTNLNESNNSVTSGNLTRGIYYIRYKYDDKFDVLTYYKN